MTRFTLEQAIEAAKEFIRRAEGIEWTTVEDRPYPVSTLATAATRRASMELTRSLAQMRRG